MNFDHIQEKVKFQFNIIKIIMMKILMKIQDKLNFGVCELWKQVLMKYLIIFRRDKRKNFFYSFSVLSESPANYFMEFLFYSFYNLILHFVFFFWNAIPFSEEFNWKWKISEASNVRWFCGDFFNSRQLKAIAD